MHSCKVLVALAACCIFNTLSQHASAQQTGNTTVTFVAPTGITVIPQGTTQLDVQIQFQPLNGQGNFVVQVLVTNSRTGLSTLNTFPTTVFASTHQPATVTLGNNPLPPSNSGDTLTFKATVSSGALGGSNTQAVPVQ
jgi:hypothetical protein